jgi:hypothetical protein
MLKGEPEREGDKSNALGVLDTLEPKAGGVSAFMELTDEDFAGVCVGSRLAATLSGVDSSITKSSSVISGETRLLDDDDPAK